MALHGLLPNLVGLTYTGHDGNNTMAMAGLILTCGKAKRTITKEAPVKITKTYGGVAFFVFMYDIKGLQASNFFVFGQV